ncbi:pesticin C-terminus-like muramidase [Pseudomonas akapageensis]|uniref:pesticin C-terminus-like muramidase n=1 Tax=Pseudomonas akapageensis TaxID=2609961 RepID=UPI0014095463|nr:pesticin C-terminus-like muramidase [Pseudomonas akapageensis]
MASLLRWLFGIPQHERDARFNVHHPPILPTLDTGPVHSALPAESSTDALPPVQNWSHPFKDTRDPLRQLTHLANAKAGFYPLGVNGLWHGGVHFDDGTLDQSSDGEVSVHCLADGEVVAYRIDQHSPTTSYIVNKLPTLRPFSRNFVLVRHRLQAPKLEGSADTPPSLTFFSLYLHLQDWAVYQSDTPLARPAFWPEGATRRVKETVNDFHPRYPNQPGLNVRNKAWQGQVLDLLPRGAQVTVSGEGDYRKLENSLGPTNLISADCSLRGYVAFSLLEPIEAGQYRVATKEGALYVRAEAKLDSDRIGELPKGTEVTISGDGDFRKLERVNQYVHYKSLQGGLEPLAHDRVVVLDQPVPIKAGDLIGHIGLYQDSHAAPEKKLHLEVFSGGEVEPFIEASRAWAQRLPASSKTWLKLAKGTVVAAHQEHFSAKRPPNFYGSNTSSDADLLVPKSLLDGLSADRKITEPAASDRKAYNWYRLDGLLHDADHKLIDGWVREEVGVTAWVSPWSWEGHDIIYHFDLPRQMLASFKRAAKAFNDEELERFGRMADEGDQGPIKQRLLEIIGHNRDSQMTAKELQAALKLPARAQSIAQLIIRAESEWYYRAQKWDALDEILGHSGSTPNLNWFAEKERLKQLSWWDEVAVRVGLPGYGKVYHFHPVGIVGNFKSLQEIKILAGKITFDAEGNDNPSSTHYSRVIHWPGNDLSGVTLGRGYDMGNRTQSEVHAHMTTAGIDDKKARQISLAHGLKGLAARDFVRQHKISIGEITKDQQISLFNAIYPDYIKRAISNYNKWTSSEAERAEWENLNPHIQDVLVDFVYQGFTLGGNPMKAGMRNSKTELISYIENTPAISQYEPGRQRARYLKSN